MAVIKNMMVRVGADFSSLIGGSQKALAQTQSWANGTGRAFQQVSGAGSALKTVLGALGVGFSVAGTLAAIKSCVEEGAKANAAMAQFGQVFGPVQEQAENSLEAIAEASGSTAYAMRGAFNQIGAFAKVGGMSAADALSFTERAMAAAADTAAFYDKSLEDVTDSLQSFLKGNYANDAALGLSCTETTRNAAANELYGKSFRELSEAQKQLTLLKMVEDANKLSGAMGQASRESGNWTTQTEKLKNQFKELMSIFGKGFIAVLTPVVQGLNWVMGGLISFANTFGGVLADLFGIQFEDYSAPAIEALEAVESAAEDAGEAAADVGNKTASGAGKAARAAGSAAAAMRQLFGFDKINKLQSESGGGGSGGSGGGGSGGGSGSGTAGGESPAGTAIARATESVAARTEKAVTDWGKRLRDFFSGLWDGISGLWDKITGLLDALPDLHFSLPDFNLSPNWEKSVQESTQQVQSAITNNMNRYTIVMPVRIDNSTAITQIVRMGGSVKSTGDWWDKLNRKMQDFQKRHPLVAKAVNLLRSSFAFWSTALSNFGKRFGSVLDFFAHLNDAGTKLLRGDFAGALKKLTEAGKSIPGMQDVKVAVKLVQDGWNTVTDWISRSYIGKALNKGVGLAKNGWKTVTDWVNGSAGGAFNKGVGLSKSGWKTVTDWVNGSAGGAFNKGVGLSKNGWKNVTDWASGSIGKALNKGVGLAKSGWKTVASFVNDSIGGTVTKKVSIEAANRLDMSDVIKPGGITLKDNNKYVGTIKAVPYAKGGIVNAATLFGGSILAGEDGREAIVPLERNMDWVRPVAAQLARELTGNGSGQGGAETHVHLHLDGREIYRTVVRNARQDAMQGVYPLAELV